MRAAELRQAIAAARAVEMAPGARPWVPLRIVRAREPMGRRVRVVPGVMGEVLTTERRPDGRHTVVVRAWCDDLERLLDAEDGRQR